MSSLTRQLVSIDIILQEIEDASLRAELAVEADNDVHDVIDLSSKQKSLLRQCIFAFQQVLKSGEDLTEYEFKKQLDQAELNQYLGSKQLLSIHTRLLEWTLDFYLAKSKAEKISDSDFSEQAEIKLDLYHTKANKARNQIKALAQALGDKEYKVFIERFKLSHTCLADVLSTL